MCMVLNMLANRDSALVVAQVAGAISIAGYLLLLTPLYAQLYAPDLPVRRVLAVAAGPGTPELLKELEELGEALRPADDVDVDVDVEIDVDVDDVVNGRGLHRRGSDGGDPPGHRWSLPGLCCPMGRTRRLRLGSRQRGPPGSLEGADR